MAGRIAGGIAGASTIVPVRDVTVTAEFYRDVLGFEIRTLDADSRFALVACNEAGVMLLGSDDDQALHATAHNIAIYIWCENVDALYETLKPKLDALPSGRVRAPFDQDYGMREFHVKDPDGCLLFFGEESV